MVATQGSTSSAGVNVAPGAGTTQAITSSSAISLGTPNAEQRRPPGPHDRVEPDWRYRSVCGVEWPRNRARTCSGAVITSARSCRCAVLAASTALRRPASNTANAVRCGSVFGAASFVRARASRAGRSASITSDFAPARRAGRSGRSSSTTFFPTLGEVAGQAGAVAACAPDRPGPETYRPPVMATPNQESSISGRFSIRTATASPDRTPHPSRVLATAVERGPARRTRSRPSRSGRRPCPDMPVCWPR